MRHAVIGMRAAPTTRAPGSAEPSPVDNDEEHAAASSNPRHDHPKPLKFHRLDPSDRNQIPATSNTRNATSATMTLAWWERTKRTGRFGIEGTGVSSLGMVIGASKLLRLMCRGSTATERLSRARLACRVVSCGGARRVLGLWHAVYGFADARSVDQRRGWLLIGGCMREMTNAFACDNGVLVLAEDALDIDRALDEPRGWSPRAGSASSAA